MLLTPLRLVLVLQNDSQTLRHSKPFYKETLKRIPLDNLIMFRGHEIESQDLVTLLSVTIDHKLSFENHTQELCQRASAQLNALKQSGYFMKPKTCKTMVQSFILANFNYCPLVWYFTSAEQIQERTLRYISDDYDSISSS